MEIRQIWIADDFDSVGCRGLAMVGICEPVLDFIPRIGVDYESFRCAVDIFGARHVGDRVVARNCGASFLVQVFVSERRVNGIVGKILLAQKKALIVVSRLRHLRREMSDGCV